MNAHTLFQQSGSSSASLSSEINASITSGSQDTKVTFHTFTPSAAGGWHLCLGSV